MNRLANGADRLRKIINRVAWRHIARFEMHFGNTAIIACDKAQQNFCKKAALFHAKAPHNAEINRALKNPEVLQNLANQGIDSWLSTPEEFDARLKADYDKYAKLIKLTGATVE